jgi:hypothetical protein
LLEARVLLKADASNASAHKIDSQITVALEISIGTSALVRAAKAPIHSFARYRSVDKRPTEMAGTGQEHADPSVLDATRGAAILACDTHRAPVALHEPGFVAHRVAERLNHVTPHPVA